MARSSSGLVLPRRGVNARRGKQNAQPRTTLKRDAVSLSPCRPLAAPAPSTAAPDRYRSWGRRPHPKPTRTARRENTARRKTQQHQPVCHNLEPKWLWTSPPPLSPSLSRFVLLLLCVFFSCGLSSCVVVSSFPKFRYFEFSVLLIDRFRIVIVTIVAFECHVSATPSLAFYEKNFMFL